MADDWRSRAEPISTNDWRARAESMGGQVSAPTDTPGITETALRGLEQGATLGFGDETNAALQALVGSVTNGNQGSSLLDAYRKYRDESRQRFKAAEEAHPYVSTAANFIGGALPTALTGGGSLAEQGLGEVAAHGAGIGALAGLGNTEADLTKGETGKAASDIALGAAGGAAIAPVAQRVSEEIGPSLKALGSRLGAIGQGTLDLGPVHTELSAFKQGLQGRNLLGKQGGMGVNEEISGLQDEMNQAIQDRLNNTMTQKKDALLGPGPDADLTGWYQNANKFYNNLMAKRSRDPEVEKELNFVKGLIDRNINGVVDPDTGTITTKGMNTSTEGAVSAAAGDANDLLNQLSHFGSAGDRPLKTNEAREFVNRLLSPLGRGTNEVDDIMNIPNDYQSLKQTINASRSNAVVDDYGNIIKPSLSDINQSLSTLLQNKSMVPNVNKIASLQSGSASSGQSRQEVLDFINKLPPDMRAVFEPKLKDLAEARQTATEIGSLGLTSGLIEKTARQVGYGSSNIAGKMIRSLYDMTPSAVKELSSRVSSVGSEAASNLGNILNQAADRDRIGRNALFYAVEQNPAYRQILRDINGETDKTQNGVKVGERNSDLFNIPK